MRTQTKTQAAQLLEEAAVFYENEAKRFGIPNAAGKVITFAPDLVNGYLARASECRAVAKRIVGDAI